MTERTITATATMAGQSRVESVFMASENGTIFRLVIIDGKPGIWQALPPLPKRPTDLGWTRMDPDSAA
jgi:hypothetical protein